MRTSDLIGIGILLLSLGAVGYETVRGPTPVEDLIPEDATFPPRVYDGPIAADADSPSVLILETSHLAQDDHKYTESAVERATNALSAYNPDLIVVEYLPPNYPRGKGNDYRPDWDLESYAEAWGMTFAEADFLRRAYRRTDAPSPPADAYMGTADHQGDASAPSS